MHIGYAHHKHPRETSFIIMLCMLNDRERLEGGMQPVTVVALVEQEYVE